MKKMLLAFLLLASTAWAGGPYSLTPTQYEIDTAISSVTASLATKATSASVTTSLDTKPSIPVSISNGGTGATTATQSLSALGIANHQLIQVSSTGFIKIGTDSTALKTKVITGTTSESEGGGVTLDYSTSIPDAKIVAFSCIVNNAYPPEYTRDAGCQYHAYISTSRIIVYNHSTNSENILSKPLVGIIWYQE